MYCSITKCAGSEFFAKYSKGCIKLGTLVKRKNQEPIEDFHDRQIIEVQDVVLRFYPEATFST